VLVLAVLSTVAACTPSQDEADVLGRYLLESLAFARQTADTALLEEIFLPDATYDDFPGQIQYLGIQDVVGYLTSVHDWGDDVYISLGNVETGSSSAVGEWFLAAVQERPIPDIIGAGTGREVSWNGLTVIEIEGGRIARAADYWDRTALILQLGGRIELPDGTVLESDLPPR
jgi:hypothetical protein